MTKIVIVTDSAACLPSEEVERYGITVVPYHVAFDQRDYRDGVDLTATEFYRMLRNSNMSPTTSAASVGEYLQAYHKAAEAAEALIVITLAATMSRAHTSAQVAAQELGDRGRVRVLDSRTAAGAQGLVVLAAARKAETGDEEATIQAAERVAGRVQLVGFLETLEYAKRSGRVPKVASWTASALGIRPVIRLQQGQVKIVELTRTRRRARERLLHLVERAASFPLHIAIQHADAQAEAEELLAEVRQRAPCIETHLLEFTPVMGAHCGPGVLAAAFWADPDAAPRLRNSSSPTTAEEEHG